MLFNNSEVIILLSISIDEPYSNLDRLTQDRISKYLESIKGDKTILAIMHSNDLDHIADKLIRIKDDRLTFDKN